MIDPRVSKVENSTKTKKFFYESPAIIQFRNKAIIAVEIVESSTYPSHITVINFINISDPVFLLKKPKIT